jgi:pimeloyl-ACP methyl ester carboxylesterase
MVHHDPSTGVTPNPGVPRAVRECGPPDAPLTVVFAHGFCLRMGAFHFQRDRLSRQWGAQVRMVFYDQRGHGLSGDASPDTFTVPQLGQDLESVLAVLAPKGPVVLVGHSMGGMTVLSHAGSTGSAIPPDRRAPSFLPPKGFPGPTGGDLRTRTGGGPLLGALRTRLRTAAAGVVGLARSCARPPTSTRMSAPACWRSARALHDTSVHTLVGFLHAWRCCRGATVCGRWPRSDPSPR